MTTRWILLSSCAAIGLACGTAPNDAEITRAVEHELNLDDSLRGEPINVAVANGRVMLTGSVDMRSDIAHAQEVAERVEGVKIVSNELNVVATAMPPAETQLPPVAAPPAGSPASGDQPSPESGGAATSPPPPADQGDVPPPEPGVMDEGR